MLLDNDEFVNIAQLVTSHSYNQNYKPFITSLRITRIPFLKRNELLMRGVQMGMLRRLAQMQDNLREFNTQLVAAPDEDKAKIERSILAQKQWIRVLQTIADGIVWRNFGFDRPILRQLSDGPAPGHITQHDYDYLATLERYLRQLRGFPIVNDLTRFLRVGDFTVLYDGGQKLIYEVKERGRRIFDVGRIFYEIQRSRKIPNPQKWRHLNAQMSIVERKVRLTKKENGAVRNFFEVDILDLNFPIKHHLKRLRKLIAIANRRGIADKTVEDGYFIRVVAIDKMAGERSEQITNEFKEQYPGWVRDNPHILSLSNYDSFYEEDGQFTRNILPYSVLPISAKNCVRMMMGHLWVTVIIDASVLERKLTAAGWRVTQVEGATEERIEAETTERTIDRERFFDIERDDERGTFKSTVTISEVMLTISSFYSFDFIVESVESSYREAKESGRTGYIAKNYICERKVLV